MKTMWIIGAAASLLCAGPAGAQLPSSWEGFWEGPCTIERQGGDTNDGPRGDTTEFKMTLDVSPLQERKGHRWIITFLVPNEPVDRRDYEMLPAGDFNFNHYILDEKTGLILDQYLVGNALRSAYYINGRLFASSYEIDGDRITSTGPNFWEKVLRETCYRGGPPCVRSLQLNSVESCVLTRSTRK